METMIAVCRETTAVVFLPLEGRTSCARVPCDVPFCWKGCLYSKRHAVPVKFQEFQALSKASKIEIGQEAEMTIKERRSMLRSSLYRGKLSACVCEVSTMTEPRNF